MELAEWIKFYERKTGEKYTRQQDFTLLYLPNKGFAEIDVDTERKTLLVLRVCGELSTWLSVLEAIAQLIGYSRITAIIIRKIKPFIRAWGGRITEERDTENGTAYICKKGTSGAYCYPLSTGNYVADIWR